MSTNAADLSPQEYHARRAREQRAEREALRLEVLERAREAIRKRAPEFPAVRTVYLVGSIVQPGRFHAGSDVNVSVDCEDIEAETPFCRALEKELDRDVDLRPRGGWSRPGFEDYAELVYDCRPSGA